MSFENSCPAELHVTALEVQLGAGQLNLAGTYLAALQTECTQNLIGVDRPLVKRRYTAKCPNPGWKASLASTGATRGRSDRIGSHLALRHRWGR